MVGGGGGGEIFFLTSGLVVRVNLKISVHAISMDNGYVWLCRFSRTLISVFGFVFRFLPFQGWVVTMYYICVFCVIQIIERWVYIGHREIVEIMLVRLICYLGWPVPFANWSKRCQDGVGKEACAIRSVMIKGSNFSFKEKVCYSYNVIVE